ncbi:MAG: ATP-binding cassette domain-containing protein [Rhodospirillaceae bacterium]
MPNSSLIPWPDGRGTEKTKGCEKLPPSPPLLALQGVTVTFGGTPLIEAVDLAIGRGDKLTLVGRNGSGKSTLLRLLAGEVRPDAGTRFAQPGCRIGTLPQEPDIDGFHTIQEFVASGLPVGDEEAMHRVDAVLDRLNLPPGRELAVLSGGKLRRAALARALVGAPDILLLDEPTNHLDLPTIEWLEAELLAFRGGLLLISHDRAFLSRLARRVAWLDRGRLRLSERPFREFESWQAEQFAADDLAAHKLDRKITSELLWMREGISGRRTRNMGRVRALQDLRQDSAERIKGGRQVAMAVSEAEQGGRLVIEATRISKQFEVSSGLRSMVHNFSTRIMRGDRVGVIGRNGAGKTTLLRLLTGQLAPDSGTVKLSATLEIAYFDQKRATLDPDATLKQVLCPFGGDAVVVDGKSRHIASYLKDFMFDTRQIDSPVRALSGGERNRLLLAKLFSRPSNLIIMDEPTNDLDMDTLDLLQEVLSDYQGTLLLVSHDRDFLDRLVTSTIVVEGNGVVAEYPGGYSDYLRQSPPSLSSSLSSSLSATLVSVRPAVAVSTPPARVQRKLGYQQQRELDQLPGRIDLLSGQVGTLSERLADPGLFGRDSSAFNRLTTELQARHAELAAAEERWLELEGLREALL